MIRERQDDKRKLRCKEKDKMKREREDEKRKTR